MMMAIMLKYQSLTYKYLKFKLTKGKTRKLMFAALVIELTGLCLKIYGCLGDSKWKVLFCGMTEYFLHNRITKDTNIV